MAIDDNTVYGLYGSQVKDLANRIKSSGEARELTSADYNWPENDPDGIALWKLPKGMYYTGPNVKKYISTSRSVESSRTILIGAQNDTNSAIYLLADGNSSSYKFMERYIVNYTTGAEGAIYSYALTDKDIVDNLTSTDTTKALSANQGKVLKDLVDSLAIRGAGAPTTSTVGQVGTLYEDTTNGDLYICTDATNPYVWEEVGAGGGGGPTVVQTTGTSTTDVMSQNAVTSMVFNDPPTKQKIRIGSTSNTAGSQSIAIGYDTFAQGNGSISFGSHSQATVAGEMNIGSTLTTYGYNNSNYRLLSGLYDPQSAHDAATKGYVDTQVSAIGAGTRKATSTGWNTSTTLDYVLKSITSVDAKGAMFYAGDNLSDYPMYVGIGIKADQADPSGYTPYLLTQQVTDDGTGTLSGQGAGRRIATYDELPATFTTNEWNALWA